MMIIPIFEQCLPNVDTEKYELITTDGKKKHQLLYKNTVTEVVYTVPNIWYNQPIEYGIDYFFGMAKIKRNFADEAKRYNKNIDPRDLKMYYDMADQYEKLGNKLILDKDNGSIFRTF